MEPPPLQLELVQHVTLKLLAETILGSSTVTDAPDTTEGSWATTDSVVPSIIGTMGQPSRQSPLA
jgi:hypothetical protein